MLWLLGGDDFRGSGDGGGSLHNDVWKTSGARWATFDKVLTGESLMYSQLSWTQVWPDKVAPRGKYQAWIECFTRAWQGAAACTAENDPYQGDLRRWSPRRSHAALYFKPDASVINTLWVLGGRATDEPGVDHQVRLKNDVWSSADGISWRLVNPGCNFDDSQSFPGLGAQDSPCLSDVDCYGDSRCVDALTGLPASVGAPGRRNRCQCQTFSPRERAAVAVFGSKMYVSGGVLNLRTTDCGEFPCNDGYFTVADDLWSSSTGEVWTRLAHASFAFSDHGLLESGGRLWAVSLGQDPVDVLDPASPPARMRQANTRRGVFLKGVPYPRSREQQTLPDTFDEEFVLIESATRVQKYVRGRGWMLVSNDTNNLDGIQYVWPDAPAQRVHPAMRPEVVAVLERFGFGTVRALARLTSNEVVLLRRVYNVTDVCIYKYTAMAVVNKCQVRSDYPDGFWNSTYQVKPQAPMTHPIPRLRGTKVASSFLSLASPSAAAAEAEGAQAEGLGDAQKGQEPVSTAPPPDTGDPTYGFDGCQQAALAEEQYANLDLVPKLAADAAAGYAPGLTCHWGFSERTNIGAVNFGGRQYVVGGRVAQRPDGLRWQEYGDTWYRDDTAPLTLIATRPRDSSSDTAFVFDCDEFGCLYEYRIFTLDSSDNELALLLDWTRTTGNVDLLSWLPGGRYRLQARAIDPAGNVDVAYVENRNQHSWTYVPRIPLVLILGILFMFMLTAVAAFLEVRRRKKKAALERYALKRMRRKFKGMRKKNDAAKKAPLKKKRKAGNKKSAKVAPSPKSPKR
jgi:hypothetical protein